jgi:uncharacterized protein (DUF1697 family)
MPRYVALLHGINVGGKNKVAMADLHRLTEAFGHTEVATYIQSSNARTEAKTTARITPGGRGGAGRPR